MGKGSGRQLELGVNGHDLGGNYKLLDMPYRFNTDHHVWGRFYGYQLLEGKGSGRQLELGVHGHKLGVHGHKLGGRYRLRPRLNEMEGVDELEQPSV